MKIKELDSLIKNPFISFKDLRFNLIFIVTNQNDSILNLKIKKNKDNVEYNKTILKYDLLKNVNDNKIIIVVNKNKVNKKKE